MDGEAAVVSEVPCVPHGRLHVSWGLGNELFVVDLPPAGSQEESTATCVQWGRPTPGQRRVAYDSLGKFEELQQRWGEADPRSPEGWVAAAEFCRAVGTVLSPDSGSATDAAGDEALALQERALWDLLALFFLGAQQAQQGAGVPAPGGRDLARWLRANAGAVAGACSAARHPLPPVVVGELREAALPEAHPDYWSCLQRLVSLGWVDEATSLLGLHSAWLRWEGAGAGAQWDTATAAQVAALEAAALLLRRFPMLRSGAAAAVWGGEQDGSGNGRGPEGREFVSLQEFLTYRRGWQGECVSVLGDAQLWQQCAAGAPETSQGLRAALLAMAGDEAAIAGAVKGWVELLVAQLLHVYPAIKPQAELKQLVQRCYAAAGEQAVAGAPGDDFPHLLAAVLEACCDSDAQEIMRVCSSYPCSHWFMAHAPLLMATHPAGAGVLGRELGAGGDQLEFYTLDYAAALMPHAATWQVAAAYLAWCPAHGRAALEALLSGLALDAADPSVAAKAVAVCRRHGLIQLAEDIQTRQGVLSWQASMLGAALSWLARSSDARRINVALAPLAKALSPATTDAAKQQQQAAEGEAGGAGSKQQQQHWERLLAALQPALAELPGGSANLALLRVHRLLKGAGGGAGGPPAGAAEAAGAGEGEGSSPGGGRVGDVIGELRGLPPVLRDACLPLVCGALAALAPGTLGEADALQLLAWLQGAESRLLPAAIGNGPAAAAAAQQRQLQQVVSVARLALLRSLAANQMAEAD